MRTINRKIVKTTCDINNTEKFKDDVYLKEHLKEINSAITTSYGVFQSQYTKLRTYEEKQHFIKMYMMNMFNTIGLFDKTEEEYLKIMLWFWIELKSIKQDMENATIKN